MRKILVIGLAAGIMGKTHQLLQGLEENVVVVEDPETVLFIHERLTIKETPPRLTQIYHSFRKSKGEKKRAASERFRKGWG